MLVDEALFGWKDLLTTLPPVDGESRLLVLPWLLGLVTGLLAMVLSLVRTRRPGRRAAAAVAPLALLALVILLGVDRPEALWLQGSVFAVLALAWLGVRYARALPRHRRRAPRAGWPGSARVPAWWPSPAPWPCPSAPGRPVATRTG